MDFYDFSIILGMSSSQLANSIIFQRGRYTTNQKTMVLWKNITTISQDIPSDSKLGVSEHGAYLNRREMMINSKASYLCPFFTSTAHL